MKSLIAAMSITVPLVLIAGCGGGSDDSSATSSASSVTTNVSNEMLARAKGKSIFKKTCVACHGENGEGIEGLGKDWTTSEYIASSTDEELVEFLRVGRATDDPMSAGEAAMPPKGGDPTLTDEDLRNVVAYMRTLNN